MRITYLIGAGASCNSLPLINNFPDRMSSFLTDFEDYFIDVSTSIDRTKLFNNKNELHNEISLLHQITRLDLKKKKFQKNISRKRY